MKGRTLGLALAGLLAPAVAGAQPASLLPTVEEVRRQYPTPMSEAQRAELLNRVAWRHRADGWGLLRKDGGSRCPAPQGVHVACDILVHGPSIRHYDVLGDAENGAFPIFNDVGPCVPGPSSGCDMSRFLAPVQPAQEPPSPPAPPVPPPVPPADPGVVAALTQEVATLRAHLLTVAEQLREHHDRINALIDHARQTDAWRTQATTELQVLRGRFLALECRTSVNLGFMRVGTSCTILERPQP